MLKYKPPHKLGPSDVGFAFAYAFRNKIRTNTITGLIEYNLEILNKKDGEINIEVFSSEKEMKEFVDKNLMNGTLVLDDKRLYYA
jgi:hypothetical protein